PVLRLRVLELVIGELPARPRVRGVARERQLARLLHEVAPGRLVQVIGALGDLRAEDLEPRPRAELGGDGLRLERRPGLLAPTRVEESEGEERLVRGGLPRGERLDDRRVADGREAV